MERKSNQDEEKGVQQKETKLSFRDHLADRFVTMYINLIGYGGGDVGSYYPEIMMDFCDLVEDAIRGKK